MIKNGRRHRRAALSPSIQATHTHIPNGDQSRCLAPRRSVALSDRRDRRRRQRSSFCRFAIPISDWGNFFLSLTRPPRFKSERELNIVVCKQQCGLFSDSKMHDKQRQRFSVKARKFFSHYNFGEHLHRCFGSRFGGARSLWIFCIAESPITPHRLERRKEGPFQNFNGPKSESVCKVGQLIGKKKRPKEESPRNVLCDIFCRHKGRVTTTEQLVPLHCDNCLPHSH